MLQGNDNDADEDESANPKEPDTPENKIEIGPIIVKSDEKGATAASTTTATPTVAATPTTAVRRTSGDEYADSLLEIARFWAF